MSTTLTQSAELAAMALVGLAAGALYDLLRPLRAFGKLACIVADALFWLVVTPAAAWMLLNANGLVVRFYALFGASLGFAAWMLGASPFIRAVCSAFARIFTALAKRIARLAA